MDWIEILDKTISLIISSPDYRAYAKRKHRQKMAGKIELLKDLDERLKNSEERRKRRNEFMKIKRRIERRNKKNAQKISESV